ncbi:hypothetical protein SAMN04487834_11042 [Sharpea azabuensis]|uniref:Uncharacterized protein n=1 Tax=Sharpea azabuensis TaxID=322505 RepID=A0A1H6XXD0_9FIRM|nr:hypothetical protein SAMN04487834_11042 [Sharpea azabuensis]
MFFFFPSTKKDYQSNGEKLPERNAYRHTVLIKSICLPTRGKKTHLSL